MPHLRTCFVLACGLALASAGTQAQVMTRIATTLDAILRLIRGAGKVPAERDSFYNVIRTEFDVTLSAAKGTDSTAANAA